jgi:hypothetical protein
MLWACNDIYNFFLGEYTIAEYYYGYVENRHAQAYWSIMGGRILYCELYSTFATVLYLGHGGVQNMGGYYRFSIYEQASHNDKYQPPPVIYDYKIFNQMLFGKHRFVFLWSCFQGNTPGNNTPTPHGMAYCWTRQPDLSQDGYSSPDSRPYCFIGFQMASPRLSEYVKESTGNLFKHWLVFFYYYALNGDSINNALRKACETVGYAGGWLDPSNVLRVGFWTYFPPEFLPPGIPPSPDNRYQGWMKVFGNGNINLLWG